MGAMADTQLAPSSPSSGLSNGGRGHIGEGLDANHVAKKLASSSRKSASNAKSPDSAPHLFDSGKFTVNSLEDTVSPENKQNGNHPKCKVNRSESSRNPGLSNGSASSSAAISLTMPNRLEENQSRNSAPPTSSPSQLKTRSRNSLLADERPGSEQRSLSELSNTKNSLLRQTRSISPMPGNSTETVANGLVSSGSSSTSRLENDTQTSDLDKKEKELFRVYANTESSQILHTPPQLPFDPSYPGLAPTAVDQKGNPLPLISREQIAKQLASSDNISSKREIQSPIREVKAEEDQIPFALDHLSREGSEMTLTRENDGRMSMPALDGTSVEDGMDYAAAESVDGITNENTCKDMDEDVLTQLRSDTNEDGVGLGMDGPANVGREDNTMMSEGDKIETAKGSQSGLLSTPMSSKNSENSAQPNRDSTSSSSRSSRRRKQADREPMDLSINDTSIGDLSNADSLESASSRRPREAHKRLKMIGGYYGRNPRPPSPPASVNERTEEEGDEIGNSNSKQFTTEHDSRAASSTVDEANIVPLTGSTTADDELLAQAIAADASITTPIKAAQQPSLTISLRNSASKNQNSKLTHAGTGLIDNGEGNNEYCETCNGVGHFICCDGCPRSFHFACINPPMDIDELPSTMGDEQDKWYCNACNAQMQSSGSDQSQNEKNSAKNKGKSKARPSSNGKTISLFNPLFRYFEETNPTIFSLPLDVRNYFKGVATANDGSYVDSIMLRPLKINRLGVVEERDPLRLKDKNGKLILCYRCGESALPSTKSANVSEPKKKLRQLPTRSSPRKSLPSDYGNTQTQQDSPAKDTLHTGWRKIISCDFCALHWHLDCLEPPMANMPSLSRKWMCPNHIDHAVRPERIPKSIANSTTIHDLPVPSEKSVGSGKHYRLRVVNDGRIDIIPDPMDIYFNQQNSSNSVQGGNSGKHDDKNALSMASTVAGSNEQRGRGLDKGWEEMDIPNSATSNGPNAISKSTASGKQLKFKYRIPEKVIQLDFWSRAEIEREKSYALYLQKIEEKSRKPLDILASIANVEFMGMSNAEESSEKKDGETSHSFGNTAKNTVEGIFGSQNARILFPDTAIKSEMGIEDAESSVDGVMQSSLRHTFVEGEYEKEFNARSLSMISPDLTPSPEVMTMKEKIQESKAANERAKDQLAASKMNVDPEEISKLRAIQALVERKGAKALLEYLLKNEDDQVQ